MKLIYITAVSAIAVMAVVPFVSEMPVLADLRADETAITHNNIQHKPQVQLRLGAEKKVVQQDQQGKQKVTWTTLQGNVVVQPGDVIRYSLIGQNSSDRPLKNLVLIQPIPKQTTYVLYSATICQNNGAKITYSIDNGTNFEQKPIIRVKLPNGRFEIHPAPAAAYTHVRWSFGASISPKTAMNATYQVQVRSQIRRSPLLKIP